MPGKKRKFKVKVRKYEFTTLSVGSVKLEVLQLVSEEEIEEPASTPLDALISVVERLSSKEVEHVFEAEVSDGTRHIIGGLPSGEGRLMLFPRPVRLRAVSIVKISDAIEKGMSSSAALIRLPQGSLRTRKIRKEVYVYEGRITTSDDVYLVILDTDLGRRYVRVTPKPIIESLVQHVLTPRGQEEESRVDGHELDAGNNPS